MSEHNDIDMEARLTEALVAELQRQAENSEDALRVGPETEGKLLVEGTVDLDALAMVLVGSLAGGP